jgi:hypothetical protein
MANLIDHDLMATSLLSSQAAAKQQVSTYNHQQLDYERYKRAFEDGTLIKKIAEVYSTSEEEILKLSVDSGQGGKVTISSMLETMVALELEHDGILGIDLQRDMERTIDFVDGWGRKWKVTIPPYIPGIGFHTEDAIDVITRQFERFGKVAIGIFICISFMRMSDYKDLQSKLVSRLSQEQRFHVRQISVRGVL